VQQAAAVIHECCNWLQAVWWYKSISAMLEHSQQRSKQQAPGQDSTAVWTM
jgi:hypothetical protein